MRDVDKRENNSALHLGAEFIYSSEWQRVACWNDVIAAVGTKVTKRHDGPDRGARVAPSRLATFRTKCPGLIMSLDRPSFGLFGTYRRPLHRHGTCSWPSSDLIRTCFSLNCPNALKVVGDPAPLTASSGIGSWPSPIGGLIRTPGSDPDGHPPACNTNWECELEEMPSENSVPMPLLETRRWHELIAKTPTGKTRIVRLHSPEDRLTPT